MAKRTTVRKTATNKSPTRKRTTTRRGPVMARDVATLPVPSSSTKSGRVSKAVQRTQASSRACKSPTLTKIQRQKLETRLKRAEQAVRDLRGEVQELLARF